MKDHAAVPYELPRLSDEDSIARARALRDSLKRRRTCRYFSDEPVPRDVIEAAIEAAGTAPNGANHQPWHFTVIESREKKRAVREAAGGLPVGPGCRVCPRAACAARREPSVLPG